MTVNLRHQNPNFVKVTWTDPKVVRWLIDP
jgi:hypothetical protein